jgi:hypothetical protein
MAAIVVETTKWVLENYGPDILMRQYWETHRTDEKGKKLPDAYMDRLQAAAGSHKKDGDPHKSGRALDIILFADKPEEKRVADALVEVFLGLKRKMNFISLIYNGWEWNGAGHRFPHGSDPVTRHITHIHIEWGETGMGLTDFQEALAGAVSDIPGIPVPQGP